MFCKKMLIICLTRMSWKVSKTVDVDGLLNMLAEH